MIEQLYIQSLEQLGREIGVDTLSFNEGTICNLEVSGTLGISLVKDEASESIILVSVVAPALSDEVLETYVRDLLGLAMGPMRDEPGIGWDDDMEALLAYRVYPLTRQNNPQSFVDAFSAFIVFIVNLRAILARSAENLSSAEKTGEETADKGGGWLKA